MSQRIHPAASRVTRLAAETPAIYVVFDLLADVDGHSLLATPLKERRAQLEKFAAKYFKSGGSIRLSPATTRLVQAKKWLSKTGATLDGIIAKRRDLGYRSGERDGMQKIKNFRSADCVVGGFHAKEVGPAATPQIEIARSLGRRCSNVSNGKQIAVFIHALARIAPKPCSASKKQRQ
ncbi:MAG: hypothetical protein ABI680_02560 [Chthoniobacteraceae bacterium]